VSFDILGRVLSHQQITDGNTYNSSYVYNLSGALIEETYPSGRKVKNTLAVDGKLSQVQSSKSNVQGLKLYANAFTYTSAGAVSSMRLGNGKFENTTFNSRLQPIQIGLGSSTTNQNLLKLNFDYGLTDNNGNVKSQTITTPTVGNVTGFIATQNYIYDSLNRLKLAVEIIPNQTGWQQTFVYDRYGNRTFDEANTTTLPKNCGTAPNKIVCVADIAKFNPSANVNDNKLVGTNYDNVGNTKIDANGQTFVYDAENKQVQVNNASVIVGQYFYDGDGKRIKKVAPLTNETTIFVYDAGGKMVAEYSTVTASQSEAKISYLTNDHLGSPRITTDATGKVISRRDFMPFGEEIQRVSYGADSVRQKFTGYERDTETDLDFAQARMYANKLGRFTTVDPYDINIEKQYATDYDEANQMLFEYITKPLHWNRYSYTLNNPLNYVDPSGELEEVYAQVNIVYDKNTIKSEEEAKKLTAKTVADAVKTYKTAGITLVVTYSAGTANTNNIFDSSQNITSGKKNEAVNVFISKDIGELTGGKSNTDTNESFINYGRYFGGGEREPSEDLLAHELGHQFTDDCGNVCTDGKINSANAYLRDGRAGYSVTRGSKISGRNSTHVPQTKPVTTYYKLPAINIYRAGAQRFALNPRQGGGDR
jgi:RHS repeat-associated protein